mgnify:CR=1 FL=1
MAVSVGVLSEGVGSEPLAGRIRAACGEGVTVRLLEALDPGTWSGIQVAVLPPLAPEAVAEVQIKLEEWLRSGHGVLGLYAMRGSDGSAAVVDDILEAASPPDGPGPGRPSWITQPWRGSPETN